MTATVQQLYEATEATWPPARSWNKGQWTLRDGQGGGKRVSAATALSDAALSEISSAARAMQGIDQSPLFMIRQGEEALDAALAEAGYDIIDPVVLYSLPIERLMDVPIPRVTAFSIWEPLAVMREIWAQGGIGPARLDVMARAKVKTGIFGRANERPAGVAFAAVHREICMVHAVEVLAHQRRHGMAAWMMRRAAFWGAEQGAKHISVLCVEQNTAANGLYRALGFTEAGRYHYRIAASKRT